MILRRTERTAKRHNDCHHGHGALWCAEMLADYRKTEPGFKYIHDNHLEPGASIGEHRHDTDEELYIILTGRGLMKIDGEPQPVGAGDVCLTRRGHRHDLVNSLEGSMHFLVICANVPAGSAP